MKHTLTFNVEEEYDPGQSGISLPVILRLGSNEAHTLAKLDTGASDCIFRRMLGERLGLIIEQGDERVFHTANSSFKAYGHLITLIVAGMEFDSLVYFAADPAFQRNVLGRNGWLYRVRLGVVDYYGKLYLSLVDDED